MSGLKDERGRVAGMVLATLLVTGAVGGVIYETMLAPRSLPAPATTSGSAASAPAGTTSAAEECPYPGPIPALPRGAVATAADMKIQHDAIQAFVKALEAYQACYNQKIKDAPAGTDQHLKQTWVAKSDHAVDQAHAMADAYEEQLKIFKARQAAEAPPEK